MQKIEVNTKKMPNGKWSCYTTYKGMDKAFVGDISVVKQMADWLNNEPVEIVWNEPVIHLPKEHEPKPQIRYSYSRIDVGMV